MTPSTDTPKPISKQIEDECQKRALHDEEFCVVCFRAGAQFVLGHPAVTDLRAMVEHALELGHLGEGSTHGWAVKALAALNELLGEK